MEGWREVAEDVAGIIIMKRIFVLGLLMGLVLPTIFDSRADFREEIPFIPHPSESSIRCSNLLKLRKPTWFMTWVAVMVASSYVRRKSTAPAPWESKSIGSS